jgi:ribosomal protein S17E
MDTVKQESEESLSDYSKRFTEEYEHVKALFGTKMFDEAVEQLDEYTSAQTAVAQDEIKKRMFDEFAHVVMVSGCDQNNDGSSLQAMTTDFSSRIDTCP